MSRRRELQNLACWLAGALLATAPLHAEPGANGDRPAGSSGEEAVLRDRSRELLHRGRPLDLVGLEEAENSFRGVSPGLADARVANQVDIDENYARRLAMYDQGSSYRTPVPPASRQRQAAAAYRRGGPAAVRDARRAAEGSPTEGLGSLLWTALLSAAATGVVCVFLRGGRPWRQAETAPD